MRKAVFSDGFSKLQASNLICVLIHWDSDTLQHFCDGKYDQVGEPTKSFIEDYIYDFITGCLEDKVSSHELKKLWTQRLGSSYTNQKNTLRRQIDEELNDLQDLILSCIDPEPTTEKIGVQLQFLDNWCGGKSRAAASREFLSPHSG